MWIFLGLDDCLFTNKHENTDRTAFKKDDIDQLTNESFADVVGC